MSNITTHPVLDVPSSEETSFSYKGQTVVARKGQTIAAALHNAGFPVHSHSLSDRNRSLECGIGKCGACEMLVDDTVRRICITQCDGVNKVSELSHDHMPKVVDCTKNLPPKVWRTQVVIVGAGPAGLATRQTLNQYGISNIVVDSQDRPGGQFVMQTHQFFFFEKEHCLGGKRGFEIADHLAGKSSEGMMLNCTVWDLLESRRVAVKNIRTNEIFYIECKYLVIAAGAVPYLPPFKNDDIPGVYTAAVVQKMMNLEFSLLGKRILTIGAGNIGYLTSYQLHQAGARVVAILEAQEKEGGFPVQANRVRRLGIPILTSKILLEAVPNENRDGIIGAIVADCEDFNPIPGTEQLLSGIDAINVCTGLVPDNQLLIKGRKMFGSACFGVGDATRIGEGTTAVLRGTQAAYEIMESMASPFPYESYLQVSKEYIDSQQRPNRVLYEPVMPTSQRRHKPFVIMDCLYGFACNPCVFSCPHGAISKSSTSTVPTVDYDKCVGCMKCVAKCPGQAVIGFDPKRKRVLLPFEFPIVKGDTIVLVDNQGKRITEGILEKIIKKKGDPHICNISLPELPEEEYYSIRGMIKKTELPEPLSIKPQTYDSSATTYICHCDDVSLTDIMEVVGDRRFVSIDEIKHTTRLGMGACRGKRCFRRLKQVLGGKGITVVGAPTPRAPLSNQIVMQELHPVNQADQFVPAIHTGKTTKERVGYLIAGGGIAGSSLFRYMSEAGLSPVMVNRGTGSSWRNIAAGRTVFSLPELSEIARHNLDLYKQLQEKADINLRLIHYLTFAHDEASLRTLEQSMEWQEAKLIKPSEFQKEISPHYNPDDSVYCAALKTYNCWQANPGKTIDLLRRIGTENGGTVLEDCEVVDVAGDDSGYTVVVRRHDSTVTEFHADHLVNALGHKAQICAKRLGIETGINAVKHQAFITRRLPPLGIDGNPLEMLIDRRTYKEFSAVYGQQLAETGQIIGCASPRFDSRETNKNLLFNSRDFLEIISEVFVNWLPCLSSVGFQAAWAGYYVEPRMIIDPEKGLFVGLRGQGFMLSQHLGKLYVDQLLGREVPSYFNRLALEGDGLEEKAFR